MGRCLAVTLGLLVARWGFAEEPAGSANTNSPSRPPVAAPAAEVPVTAETIAAELTEAKKAYEAEFLAAREELLEAFDPVEKKIAENPKLKTEDRVRQVESLLEEKKAFESEGVLPKSFGLKAAVSDYRIRLATAQRTCERAFDEAAEKYLKLDFGAAKGALAEKAQFFPPGERPVVRDMPKDSRKFWRFDRTHGSGYFKQIGNNKWEEIGADGAKMGIWIERKRTKEYVELEDLKRGYLTRLGQGKAWLASNQTRKFNPSPHGAWEK